MQNIADHAAGYKILHICSSPNAKFTALLQRLHTPSNRIIGRLSSSNTRSSTTEGDNTLEDFVAISVAVGAIEKRALCKTVDFALMLPLLTLCNVEVVVVATNAEHFPNRAAKTLNRNNFRDLHIKSLFYADTADQKLIMKHSYPRYRPPRRRCACYANRLLLICCMILRRCAVCS